MKKIVIFLVNNCLGVFRLLYVVYVCYKYCYLIELCVFVIIVGNLRCLCWGFIEVGEE